MPALERYIAIPNQSPAFDPDWAAHGHMERAVELVADWARTQQVPGLRVEVVRLARPHAFHNMDGAAGDGGDPAALRPPRQRPPMEEWGDEGSGRGRRCCATAGCTAAAAPTTATPSPASQPCRRCNKRCPPARGADRGLRRAARPTCRRTSRRSPTASARRAWWCSAGCGNYDQLWVTDGCAAWSAARSPCACSTRKCTPAPPTASTVSFRILRQLLGRLEDAPHRRDLPPGLHVEIPAERRAQAAAARCWAPAAASPSPARRGRWWTTSPSSSSAAPGGRSWRSPAPPACRRWSAPATCCARRRR
ncbi:MAG: hypothetical protein U0802_15615 [Candidatus Binatia bacterium]